MNPEVAAQHRAKISGHQRKLKTAFAITAFLAFAVGISIRNRWSVYIQVSLLLVAATQVFEMASSFTKWMQLHRKLTKARRG